MAGVVLPSLVIFGLMAIPYLDFNKKGNGYYTIDERKFSYLVFQFGFLELWVDADHPGHVLARTELELLRAVRVLGSAQGAGAEQRRPVAILLDQLAAIKACPRRLPAAAWLHRVRLHLAAANGRASCWCLATSLLLPPLMADDDLPQVFRQDGLHPLHADVQFAAVHGVAADEDGAALDVEPEIHHQHSRVLLELLIVVQPLTCGRGSMPSQL